MGDLSSSLEVGRQRRSRTGETASRSRVARLDDGISVVHFPRPLTELQSAVNRREVVCSLLVLPGNLVGMRASFAQSKVKTWRIGVINPGTKLKPLGTLIFPEFFATLKDLGYVEGRNLTVQWQFADNDQTRMPALAEELVKGQVDLILTNGTPATQAARQATTTIPILFLPVSDPVGNGLAKSLARPGGNVTGQAVFGVEISVKRLEILAEAVPGAKRVAWLMNPGNAGNTVGRIPLENAARRLGRELVQVPLRSASELEAAFDVIVRERAGALQISVDPTLNTSQIRIAELALQRRLPHIFGTTGRTLAEKGLMGYGSDNSKLGSRGALQADKIFKGANPGDIPIELPTHFDFFINLKIAKTLGITIPPALMVQATRVIE